MPAPRDNGQLTSWLKQHGYQWVLKAPSGAIVSVADAIRQIEAKEQEDETVVEPDLFTVKGSYYSEAVQETGHVWMGQHDDDTGVFEFFMSTPTNTEEKDGVTRYTFSDGVVFVRHDGALETEWEDQGEPQPQK